MHSVRRNNTFQFHLRTLKYEKHELRRFIEVFANRFQVIILKSKCVPSLSACLSSSQKDIYQRKSFAKLPENGQLICYGSQLHLWHN